MTASSTTEWTTSDGSLATITTASSGGGRGAIFAAGGGSLATGVAAGSVTITAVYTPASGSTASATTPLTVTNKTPKGLVVNPSSAAILLNGTQAFVAMLIYTDGSSTTVTGSASWTTSN